MRDEIFAAKKSLKDTTVSVAEHLTKYHLSIYKAVKKVVDDDKKVWTRYGLTLVEHGGKVKSIRSMNDIDNKLKSRKKEFVNNLSQYPPL